MDQIVDSPTFAWITSGPGLPSPVEIDENFTAITRPLAKVKTLGTLSRNKAYPKPKEYNKDAPLSPPKSPKNYGVFEFSSDFKAKNTQFTPGYFHAEQDEDTEIYDEDRVNYILPKNSDWVTDQHFMNTLQTHPIYPNDPNEAHFYEDGEYMVSDDLLTNFEQGLNTDIEGVPRTKRAKKVVVVPGEMIVCTYPGCGKEFPKQSGLKSHSKTHDEGKQFECQICNCGFRRTHDLKRHHRSLHQEKKSFTCKNCNKDFSRMVLILIIFRML